MSSNNLNLVPRAPAIWIHPTGSQAGQPTPEFYRFIVQLLGQSNNSTANEIVFDAILASRPTLAGSALATAQANAELFGLMTALSQRPSGIGPLNWTTPEAHGAVGDGVANDTAAWQAALDTGLTVVGRAGSTYLVSDLTNDSSIADLNGSILAPFSGADWLMKLSGQSAVIRNGYVNDSGLVTLYSTTTTQSITGDADPNTALGAPVSFTVASTAKLAIGKLIALTQANGLHFVAKITNISGLTVTVGDTPYGNVSNGALVETAHGLLVTDQNLNGRIENIIFPVCPVGVELVNTATPAEGHEQTLSCLRMDAFYLCGVFRDVDVATAHFLNIVAYGHANGDAGYVGYYADGRNAGLYPTGGNEHTDVNFELAETAWALRGCQLDEFHNCVADTYGHSVHGGLGWDVGDVCQKLRFTNIWGSFTNGQVGPGTGVQISGGCLGIFLNGLYTRLNVTADLSVDANSQVYLIDETWGESQVFTGGGAYNQVFPTHIGGAPGNESLRINNNGPTQVNRWEAEGNTAGNGVLLSTNGSDTDISAFVITKGAGAFVVQNNLAGPTATMLIVSGPINATDYIELRAGVSGATVTTNAGDLAFNSATGLTQFANVNSFSANGTVATVLGLVGPIGSHTAVQEWLTFKNASGATRYVPAF